jgi:hypothetical protein
MRVVKKTVGYTIFPLPLSRESFAGAATTKNGG